MYYLLVTFTAGRDAITFLLDCATQEQFFERALQHTVAPGNVSVTRLSTESFELLERGYRGNGRLIEGD